MRQGKSPHHVPQGDSCAVFVDVGVTVQCTLDSVYKDSRGRNGVIFNICHCSLQLLVAKRCSSDGLWVGADAGAWPAVCITPSYAAFFVHAGNFFFAGARTFFRSLESAVFLFR